MVVSPHRCESLGSTVWLDALSINQSTSKRVLGAEHRSTLTSMNNLAFTRKIQYREEAIALMRKCVQLRGRVLGSDHPFTLSSREALIQ
jgi:hypothetical protein